MEQDKAFITLLSSHDYLPAVLAMKASMDRVNTKYPLVVLTTQQLSSSRYIIEKLKNAGCIIEFTDSVNYNQKVIEEHKGETVLNTASKIKVFTLKQYNKLVYMDADVMFLQNVDDLFDYPDGSMMWDTNSNIPFSALFVCCPKYHDYGLYSYYQDRCCGYDGALFAKLWFHVYDSEIHKIPQDYCQFFRAVNKNTKVVHYCNAEKPWIPKYRDYFIDINKEQYFSYRALLPSRHIPVKDCVLNITHDIPLGTRIGNTYDLFNIRMNKTDNIGSSVVMYHCTHPTLWERKENVNNIFSFDGTMLHVSEPVLNENKINFPIFVPPSAFAIISIIHMADISISNEQLNNIVFDTIDALFPDVDFQRIGNDYYINGSKFIGVENNYNNNRELQTTASVVTLSYNQYKEYFEALNFTKPITGLGDEIDIGDFEEFKIKFRNKYEELLNHKV